MTAEELLAKYAAGERSFVKADLRGVDLTRANLSKADLSKAKLSRTNLSGTDLRGANLSLANLSNANLISADLSGANLQGSIFTNANLTGANLSDTILAARTYTRKITDTSIYETITNTAEAHGNMGTSAYITLIIRPASDAPPTQFDSKHIIDAANNVTLYICISDSVIRKDYQLGIIAAAKAMKGQLAGYPLRNIVIQVTGGRMNDADSNVLVFEKATELALKDGLNGAKPCFIEPIYKVTLWVQEDYMGDTMSLVNQYKGDIVDIHAEGKDRGYTALLPYRHFTAFEQDFKKVSHSDGQFDAEFDSYQEVKKSDYEQLIAKK